MDEGGDGRGKMATGRWENAVWRMGSPAMG